MFHCVVFIRSFYRISSGTTLSAACVIRHSLCCSSWLFRLAANLLHCPQHMGTLAYFQHQMIERIILPLLWCVASSNLARQNLIFLYETSCVILWFLPIMVMFAFLVGNWTHNKGRLREGMLLSKHHHHGNTSGCCHPCPCAFCKAVVNCHTIGHLSGPVSWQRPRYLCSSLSFLFSLSLLCSKFDIIIVAFQPNKKIWMHTADGMRIASEWALWYWHYYDIGTTFSAEIEESKFIYPASLVRMSLLSEIYKYGNFA